MSRQKFAALFEVTGVYVFGLVLALILSKILGIEFANPLTVLVTDPNADYMVLAKDLALLLGLQYVGLFVPVALIGWWHRRRSPVSYGLTTNNHSLKVLAGVGIIVFAVGAIGHRTLLLVDTYVSLGEGAPWLDILMNGTWNFPFWVLMAIGSFGLIPIVEELYYRGYVQNRLSEDFHPATAIIITTCYFAFSHSQYQTLSILNVGTMLNLILSTIALGYAFHKTGSLITPIIAHALMNLPIRGAGMFILVAVMLVIIILNIKHIKQAVMDFGAMVDSIPTKWVALAASIFVSAFALGFAMIQEVTLLIGLVLFVAAMILLAIDRKKIRQEAVTA